MPPPRATLAVEDALQALVTVRRAQRRLRGTPIGERLGLADALVAEALGPTVTKAAAARALGVSSTGIDRAQRTHGVPRRIGVDSSRHARLATDEILALLDVAQQLADRGRRGRILTEAARLVAARQPPGRLPPAR